MGLLCLSVCSNTHHDQCRAQVTLKYEYAATNSTLRLDPRHTIVSALAAASIAPCQLSGCSRQPVSPKCTIVSLSADPQSVHVRPVSCRYSEVCSVTSNNRKYKRSHVEQTCQQRINKSPPQSADVWLWQEQADTDSNPSSLYTRSDILKSKHHKEDRSIHRQTARWTDWLTD